MTDYLDNLFIIEFIADFFCYQRAVVFSHCYFSIERFVRFPVFSPLHIFLDGN